MLNRISLLIVSLFLLVLSIVLYILAPDFFSNEYNVILLIVFIFVSYLIIRHTIKNGNFFNFHILFVISYFFVNFVYPVFLYPIDPEYFPVFKKSFNSDVITKATALSLIGITSYLFGLNFTFNRNRHINKIKEGFNKQDIRTLYPFFTLLSYFLFIIIVGFTGMEIFSGNLGITSKIPPGLMVFFQISLGITVIILLVKGDFSGRIFDLLWKFDKSVFLIVVLFVLIFLFTGDRGPIIQLFLIGIGTFSFFIRPIKFREFIVTILIGMFILTFVSYARSRTASTSNQTFVERGIDKMEINSFFDLGMDLIVNNRNLYVGYEYVQENGFLYGRNMVYHLFAPIPYMPTLVSKLLYNEVPSKLTTARIITDISKSNYGLGTNMVIDIYMSFGLLGIITFMVLLGFTIRYFEDNIYTNFRYSIIYLFMLGFSIYLPRTSILDPFRYIVWAFLLVATFKIIIFFSQKKLNNTN